MTRRRLNLDQLPAQVSVFAVPGVILLAGATLPLIAFEPRYLALVDDALGQGRLFALVQPHDGTRGAVPGLFTVGSLARITAFGETSDGRYLITATGVCRFRVAAEAEGRSGYRRVVADYGPYVADLDAGDDAPPPPEARDHLLGLARTQLAGMGVEFDLGALANASEAELGTRLAMTCPFSPDEKQALLEAPTHADRRRLMIAILQTDLLAESGSGPVMH